MSKDEGKILREVRIKTTERNIKKLLEFVESLKKDSVLPIHTKVLTREEVRGEWIEKLDRIKATFGEQ
jgi:hypothetical protein